MNNKAPCGNELLWAEVAICREHGTSCAPRLLNRVEPIGGPGNYLVSPKTYEAAPPPLDGLREAARLVVDRFLDTPEALAGVHVALAALVLAALRDEGETT